MKNILWVDGETTGTNPNKHQMYEIAMIPMINMIVRLDLAWHTYIRHESYCFQREVLFKFGERITTKPENVPEIHYKDFEEHLNIKLYKWFQDHKVTLGGKNVGGFDAKFIAKMAPGIKQIGYSCIDIGDLFETNNDEFIPSLNECKRRAIQMGHPINYNNDHSALNDAMLCAELYSRMKFNKFLLVKETC